MRTYALLRNLNYYICKLKNTLILIRNSTNLCFINQINFKIFVLHLISEMIVDCKS